MFKPCDLIIVDNDTSWIGRIISFVTRSPFVHVATVVAEDGSVIEGAPQGVVNNNIETFKDFELYRVTDITPDQISKVIDFLKSELGRPYDFGAIVYLLWLIITFNTKARNAWDDANKWTCTELVATAFATAGIVFRDDIPLANISANDIATSDIVEEVL